VSTERILKSPTITIIVPGPPKGKGRPRFSRKSGTVYTPEATVKYENFLSWEAKRMMLSRPPLEGPLHVLVVSAFPVPKSYSKRRALDCITGAEHPAKKPDIDNIVKMLDALNGIVWRDDAQIVRCDVRKVYTKEPELTIQVREL
jgi:Holliday junction resolvase RusA-like endonuclease